MDARLSFPRLFVALLFVLFSIAGVQAQTVMQGALTNPEALAISERWATAVGQADTAELNKLLHSDYLHIHATALVESKAKFIEALQTGARKYDPIRIEESNVRVFGDTAVITGKFVLRATIRDRIIEGVNRFTLVVANTPSGVQVATFQATAIPQ